MFQHILVFIIVLTSISYLIYQWKLKEIFGNKENSKKLKSSSCSNGECHGCAIPKKPKKIT
ncbi:hypothetical protein QEJ31_12010 [Pigmentibacter sp. JX0631]|uniref:hypothetical protein n=1 Tax=Pigmentibacter sp. JX0631 TaxID=2976982 RepID=UPI002468EDA4|nr:hypothetical protein [Pigmentibacter sp. JX0631]WGL59247.1 hypothetical protein QEJ31_12010 [Pigmentibacter sp. JX0631]